jgi:hypothetical protein
MKPYNVDVLALLITGLGGSGTHAVANKLLSMKLDMPHEEIGALGAVVSGADFYDASMSDPPLII